MIAAEPGNAARSTPSAFVTIMLWAMLVSISTLMFGQISVQAHGAGAATPPWPLWSAYNTHFVDASGRVIDHDAGDRTTSEGQAYAMFFSLVGNDRAQFDHLLQWTVENLAQGDLTAHLPAWEWGRAPDGTWRVLDSNSAADADLWISYTLLQAGHLWSQPRYRSLGLALAAQISQRETRELPGLGWTLLPAANGFETVAQPSQRPAPITSTKGSNIQQSSRPNIWILNPSYSPLPVLTGIAYADPHGPWRSMAAQLPALLARSSVQGFAMDWVAYRADESIVPAVLPNSPQGTRPVGSYDAIRVYLWAGMAPASMTNARLVLHASSGMQRYLADHVIPPRTVDANGNATSADGPIGFSAALLPYLSALRSPRLAALQQNRLTAMLNPATGLYGSPPRYYDQNLALFAAGWQQRRYRFSADGELQTPWNSQVTRHPETHRSSGPEQRRIP